MLAAPTLKGLSGFPPLFLSKLQDLTKNNDKNVRMRGFTQWLLPDLDGTSKARAAPCMAEQPRQEGFLRTSVTEQA